MTTLTIMCDNSISRPGLVGEHGFSVLIERDGVTSLFDTGPGISLPINFEFLGKDPAEVRRIILSHGHYDHTGGLKWLVTHSRGVEVLAHPAMFSRHMVKESQQPGSIPRYIGCPWEQGELEGWGATFTFIDKTTSTAEGVTFLTGYASDPKKVAYDHRLVLPDGEGLVPDPMADDASLLLETGMGRVLLLGCAHAGVLNILDYIRDVMGIARLTAVLGGTHLMFYGGEALSQLMDTLEEFSVQTVGVSHCTGMQAAFALASRFKDRFAFASAGMVFKFD
jgi:7,8-dihydropterin-6-yl-methyl-4-(beta-D-ribofuranosyl)aminobenzene 5'-phosphate synthase